MPPPPEPPSDLEILRNWVGTVDAKSEYFLMPEDLRSLDYQSLGGGVGIGAPSKFYNPKDLKAAAILKHGEAGFKSKQDARKKRESKKREREDAADEALAALAPPPAAPAAGAPAPPPATGAAAADTSALSKSLLKLAKKALGFTDGGGPKNWRVEAPGIPSATFAALAGRPSDTTLRTFVKAGAYYSHDVSASALFGLSSASASSHLTRVFKREGVGIQIDDRVTLKYKPSDMTLALLGGGEIVVTGF